MELFFIQNSIYNINRNNIYISDTNKKTLTDLFYLLNPFLINYKYIKNYILSGVIQLMKDYLYLNIG